MLMVMLADRLKTTAVTLLALVLLVFMRRQADALYVPPDMLNIINMFTVVVMCVLVVIIARAWLPGRS